MVISDLSNEEEYMDFLSKSITTLIKTNVLQVINPKLWMERKDENQSCTTFVQELSNCQNKYVEHISNDLLCGECFFMFTIFMVLVLFF